MKTKKTVKKKIASKPTAKKKLPAKKQSDFSNEIDYTKELHDYLKPRVYKYHPFEIGKTYVIRTVTMIQLGKLKEVYAQELVLSDASWIADTGRFHQFLKDPTTRSESEPFTADCIVGRGAIVDAQVVNDVILSQK